MINSNSVSSSSVMSAKNSSVVSSSKSAASTAPSKSAAKMSQKVTPKEVLPLSKRTSVNKVNPKVESLSITEKNGSKVEVTLIAPSYREAEHIDDARQVMAMDGNHAYMRLTTPEYQEQLFTIMHNLEVNGQPHGYNLKPKVAWKFADKHIEAFNWIINKANSFLSDVFNPTEN